MTTKISMLAIDLAKGSFQVCAVGRDGTVPYNRVLSRTRMAALLAEQPACAVAMEEPQQGFLIGAAIHDVAQVVGAGFSVSDVAGETATVVKLRRVALLRPVLLAVAPALRPGGAGPKGRMALAPWFMALFLGLVALGSVVALPASLVALLDGVSRACLVTAIAALGIKTSLKAPTAVGGGHLAVVAVETVALLALALLAVHVFAPV